MRKIASLALAALFASSCQSVFADVAAIHTNALPNDPAVVDALKDITALEPYTHRWTPEWRFPVDKKEATARLTRDVNALNDAVRSNPENVELLLLAALAGRYAYNVDVSGTFDSSTSDLAEVTRLAPGDLRAPWFHASLLCQTADQPPNGATEFLAIEDTHNWQDLPPAFWADYMECATITNMPAHVLRAADHIQQLHATGDEITLVVKQTAQKRFTSFDPKKDYAPRDIWEAVQAGEDIAYTATTCGVRFRIRGDWKIDRMDLTNSSCVAHLITGPYQSTASSRQPGILVMVQRPQKNETLDAYAKRILPKGGPGEPFTPSHCPADHCMAMKTTKPNAYGKDGDGHALTVFFEREQPAFPGLIFESPTPLPSPGNAASPQYYRPSQIPERIPGKLYYTVMLDTAASIDDPATSDFNFFLANLIVE